MISIVKLRKYWYVVSATLVLASVILFAVFGLRLGIDFTGGSLMELNFTETRPSAQVIIDFLAQQGIGSASVQPIGETGFIARFSDISEEKHQEIIDALKQRYAVDELRFDSIGPTIGQELRNKTMWAIIIVSVAIVAYIAFAFRKVSQPVSSWKYGVIATVALIHDVAITVGIFVILGMVYGLEVNAPFVAALLTILGYSVNDTIVIFDRIRENLLRRVGEDFEHVIQVSLNEVIVRSINSSFTVLLVLFAILLLGGSTIRDFVLALIIGVSVGAYSSIFVAAPLLVTWQKLQSRK